MFHTSAPATGPAFHDRVVELQRLTTVVAALAAGSPRWLAIVGVRKVGKTSLVLEAARRLQSATIRFVTVDVFETLPISSAFFRGYALRVADRLLGSTLGLSLEALAGDPQTYRDAVAASSAFATLPGSLRATLIALADRVVDGPFIRAALELPEQIAQASGVRAVVAIDEFQELAAAGRAQGAPDPLPLMRSVWQQHRAVTYIVSGSARSMLLELVTSRRSPFFQHFDLMELGPFRPEDALALLVQHSPARRRIPAGIARKAVEVLGGHPFYLQVLGELLVQRSGPSSELDLKEAVQELLFTRTGRLALYFQNEFERVVGRSSQLAAALTALSEGPRRLTDISAHTRTPSGATVRLVERLGDAVMKGQDGLYRLADPTLGLWLRWRAPGGAVVPMKVIGDEAEQAVADHLAALGFDLVYQSRASRGAFDLLATRGARQLGVQVKRTGLPVRFSPPAWKRMEAEGRRFGWRWIVAVVTPIGEVIALDPARRKAGRQMTLDRGAAIANLLSWLDDPVT